MTAHRAEEERQWATALVDVDRPVPDLPTGGATHDLLTVVPGSLPLGSLVVEAAVDPVPARYLADLLGRRFGQDALRVRSRRRLRPALAAAGVRSASILVCSRGRPDQLDRCLASVAAMGCGHEVVVVDNASATPATREVVERWGSETDGFPLGRLDGGQTIRLHLERLDLAGGAYALDVWMFDASWDRPFDYRWGVLPVTVSGPVHPGPLGPPRKWSVG